MWVLEQIFLLLQSSIDDFNRKLELVTSGSYNSFFFFFAFWVFKNRLNEPAPGFLFQCARDCVQVFFCISSWEKTALMLLDDILNIAVLDHCGSVEIILMSWG